LSRVSSTSAARSISDKGAILDVKRLGAAEIRWCFPDFVCETGAENLPPLL